MLNGMTRVSSTYTVYLHQIGICMGEPRLDLSTYSNFFTDLFHGRSLMPWITVWSQWLQASTDPLFWWELFAAPGWDWSDGPTWIYVHNMSIPKRPIEIWRQLQERLKRSIWTVCNRYDGLYTMGWTIWWIYIWDCIKHYFYSNGHLPVPLFKYPLGHKGRIFITVKT